MKKYILCLCLGVLMATGSISAQMSKSSCEEIFRELDISKFKIFVNAGLADIQSEGREVIFEDDYLLIKDNGTLKLYVPYSQIRLIKDLTATKRGVVEILI